MKDNGKNLLNKMEALKTYPPRDEVSSSEINEDYQHATEFLQNDSKFPRIGTLSQSEWEVVSK